MKDETDNGGPREIIGRASVTAAGTIYQQGLSFMAGLIIARVIGAAEYGIFNLARTLVELTAIVTRMGLDVGLQRFFGEAAWARDRAYAAAVLRRLRLLSSTIALLPVALVALGLGRVLEADVYQFPQFAQILLALALGLPFLTDIAILGGAYRGILKMSPTVLAESVLMPTVRLTVVLILFALGWRLWAVVVGTVLGSFVSAALLALRARSDFKVVPGGTQVSWAGPLHVLSYSSVLAGAVLVATLTNSMDLLVLGRFVSAAALGQYSLVKMLLVLTGVVGTAFTSGLGSLIAERYARGDREGMVRVMSLTFRFVTLVTLPVFAVFLFWGAQLALLFGPSFALSQSVVSWLAASQFVFTVFAPTSWVLSMTGRHFVELKILSIVLVISAVACVIAVPAFGQLGAAIATCGAWATTSLLRVLLVRRVLGAFPFGSDVFVIAASGISLAWVSHALAAQLSSSSLWSTVLGIAVFALLYAAANWTYLLRDSERDGISHALSTTVRRLFGRTADAPG